MLKDKIFFIGTSVMMLKCIEVVLKDFKNVFIVTNDGTIRKKYKKLVIFTSLKKIKKIKPDYLFSILNNRILTKPHLRSVKKYSLNFHDGPLPKYAGMFSSTWAIFNNEKHHGVCWHKIENKLDAGDILKEKKFKIKSNDTSYDIDTKGSLLGIKLFRKIIQDLKGKKKLVFKKQQIKKRTYFKKNDLKKILKKFKKNKENSIILRSLIVSPQKQKIMKSVFKGAVDIKIFKNSNIYSQKMKKKIESSKAIKFIKFLNHTIKTKYKFEENKNDLSRIALNSHDKWDSLSHVKLLSKIEQKFKISIDEKNIDNFSNVELMLSYFDKKKISF